MGTNLEKIQGILDTTSAKADKFMPGISPRILPWENLDHIPKNSSLYITVPQLASIVRPKLIERGFFNVVSADK
jgi:hypothetical protein